jgi:hypothetical protein
MDVLTYGALQPVVRDLTPAVAGVRDPVRADVVFVGMQAGVGAFVRLHCAPSKGDEQCTKQRGARQHGGEATPRRGEKTT